MDSEVEGKRKLSGKHTSSREKSRFLFLALWVCAGGEGSCFQQEDLLPGWKFTFLPEMIWYWQSMWMTFMTRVYADSSLKPRTMAFVLPFPYLFHYSVWHFICLCESSLVACSAYAMPKERHLGFGYPAFSSGRAVHLSNIPFVQSQEGCGG